MKLKKKLFIGVLLVSLCTGSMSSFAYQLEDELTQSEVNETEASEVETVEIAGVEVEVPDEEKKERALSIVSYDAESEEVTTTTEYMTGDVEYTAGSEDIPSPRKIIGADERKLVSSSVVSNYPYSAICYLTWTWPNKETGIGTGTLVNGNLVLTASHCLYDAEKGGWARNLMVKPGGIRSKHEAVGARAFDILHDWKGEDGIIGWDYGLITLKESTNVGYFGVKACTDEQLLSKTAYLFGYPEDKNHGTLWYASGYIINVFDDEIDHAVDMVNGQSGGPLTLTSDYTTIVGVQSWHWDAEWAANTAARVTTEMVEFISWYK